MRPASVDEFLADRFGRYVLGSRYLVWCVDQTLGGVALWGTLEEVDASPLLRLFDIDIRADRYPPFDLVLDASRLTSLASTVYDLLAAGTSQRLRALAALIRRHAVIAPRGIVGTMMAGFLPLFGHRHPWKVFNEVEAAFAWLDRSDVGQELQKIIDEAVDLSPLVRDLRAQLDQDLQSPVVARLAQRLGRSSRALQRELQNAGTSFRAEVEQARIEAGKRLLVQSDDKLHAIAAQVGFRSPSAFSRRFRERLGQSPQEYRRSRRS